jgi:hypothetical protein
MAMVLAGVGSIVAHELGKLALDNAPILKQVASDTAVGIAKKSFDLVLDQNPNFANFLGHFGIHKFNSSANHKTFTHRGRRRHITFAH